MSTPRVVVGVDGSPLAWAATRYAAHHASLHGQPLQIVHAFASDMPLLGFGALTDRSVVLAEGQRIVDAATARAHTVDPGLVVTGRCYDGFASPALINSAGPGTSVVVVGAVGHGALNRMLVGAVAMQVVMHAAAPVIVVGDESAQRPSAAAGPVVVGIDGSPPSHRALRAAHAEAAVRGAALHVVRVWEPSGLDDPTLSDEAAWDDFVHSVEETVARTGTESGAPAVDTSTEVVHSNPVGTLLERSEEASLLVVGARGAGGFAGLKIGSTAMRLIGHARAPILITR